MYSPNCVRPTPSVHRFGEGQPMGEGCLRKGPQVRARAQGTGHASPHPPPDCSRPLGSGTCKSPSEYIPLHFAGTPTWLRSWPCWRGPAEGVRLAHRALPGAPRPGTQSCAHGVGEGPNLTQNTSVPSGPLPGVPMVPGAPFKRGGGFQLLGAGGGRGGGPKGGGGQMVPSC